jgi:transposase
MNMMQCRVCVTQVDGDTGYEQTQATLVGCWAYARRKFMEAKKSR